MLEYDKNEENEEIGRESEILEKEEKEFNGKRLNLKTYQNTMYKTVLMDKR